MFSCRTPVKVSAEASQPFQSPMRFVFSCNVPMAQLGIALGQDRIRQQAELFGFGKKVKYPMTSTASVYPENMDDAQVALSAFGQYDVRSNPLQMAMVSAAVANQGVLMTPNLVGECFVVEPIGVGRNRSQIFSRNQCLKKLRSQLKK